MIDPYFKAFQAQFMNFLQFLELHKLANFVVTHSLTISTGNEMAHG